MPRPETSLPRVHLADPAAATPVAHAVRDAVAEILVGDPDRRAAFERLQARVALRVDDGTSAGRGLVGLVFDRGTLTVWDGAPPGGAQVRLALPAAPTGRRQARHRTAVAFARRRVRLAVRLRHLRPAVGALRVLGLL